MNHLKKIKLLQTKLKNASNSATKVWFDNYLQGAIEYRGVKTPEVTKIVKAWRKEQQLDELDLEVQLELTADLIRQKYAEDKFAGTIYLQLFLVHQLPLSKLFRTIDQLYQEGCFFDWSTSDWFCTRVLNRLIDLHNEKAVRKIAAWHSRPNFWQRRSAVVGLRGAVKDKKHHPTIVKTIAKLVTQQDRFIQTGIGWLLADLSKVYPKAAEKILEEHFDLLSKEVIRRHAKHLPKYNLYKQRLRNRQKSK